VSHRVGLCDLVTDDLAFGPFHIRYAAGTEPRLAEYSLRYDAFVEEHHWESPEECRDRLERDEFDSISCSALVIDSATGEPAACQRLILPEHLPHGRLTNAEREYRPLPSTPAIDFATMPRFAWAEASRLTIARGYRWGSAKTALPAIVAVSYASLALALALDRTVLFTISDPRTARLTRRIGIAMRQVGRVVDFHGRRAVFEIELAQVLGAVPPGWQPLVERLIDNARQVVTAGAIDALMSAPAVLNAAAH
jgi:N-acyl-L-homoserine lactone synthetase